ncbi:hypothetical protein V493_07208 [Pseudogymnoascus sp. VKM F-4281 (FW-2241)]|nr:hypothetical protein V493_07208 [Pseudogymnoascus sp. VKM F-4281 (FW-2241)]
MDPVTPIRTRASISSSSLSRSEEEILKKLHTHPERLSSGELAKTLLSTFNKNLGKFSFATTFDVYLRWLEAQRRAPQTTINYNWKNVVMQWAQSLKARDIRLKDLVLEVEHWKRSHGPFLDPKTEVNPRYPPTIDELEVAYKMDLRPHSARNPPAAHSSKKENRYLPEEPRCGYKWSEPNKHEVAKSPAKQYSSSPTQPLAHANSPGGIIGLLVLNVRNYTNNEVVEIFHPDSRHTVTRLEAWLTNRTVHFRTVEDRDRAYYLLPDDIKSRKEKDLTRPLVKIYSQRGNKARSDIDTSSGHAGSPEKIFRRLDDAKGTPEEAGLYFINTGRYSRKDVEGLFDERDALNIAGVERLSKFNVVVQFPSICLRDKALERLPSSLKDDNETPRRTSLFVVLFDPKLHDRHPASRLRDRQINGPDKFGARADKNECRIANPLATKHEHVSRWGYTRNENYDFRLPDRTLSDDGRLSRYESANNSSPDFGRHKGRPFNKIESPVFSGAQQSEQEEFQYLNDEERMMWEQDHGEVFAGLWLEKLADEIMERRSKLDKPIIIQNAPVKNAYDEEYLVNNDALQHAASVINESGKAKARLKRARTPDPIDNKEYMGDYLKRTKRVNNFAGIMDTFEGNISDDDGIGLDCSMRVLTRVKRPNALHMWDLLDGAKRPEKPVESETSSSSENCAMVVEETSDGDSDGEDEAPEADIQRSNNELEAVSSPEDGWCSSHDYWAGSSGGSELEEGASGQVDLPEADTVEIGNSDINLDAGIAYDSSQTPSDILAVKGLSHTSFLMSLRNGGPRDIPRQFSQPNDGTRDSSEQLSRSNDGPLGSASELPQQAQQPKDLFGEIDQSVFKLENPIIISCHCNRVNDAIKSLPLCAFGTSAKIEIDIDHGYMARKFSGQLAVSYFSSFQPEPYTLAKTVCFRQGDLDGQNNPTLYFCPVCGCHLFKTEWEMVNEELRPTWAVATGVAEKLLVPLDIFRLSRHINVGQTGDGGLSIWMRARDDDTIIPTDMPLQSKTNHSVVNYAPLSPTPLTANLSSSQITNGDILDASCSCGTIKFHVTRPTYRSTLPKSQFPDLMIPYHTTSDEIPNPSDKKWWIRGNLYLAGTCACTSCRRCSGFDIQSWAFIPRANIFMHHSDKVLDLDFSNLPEGLLRSYNSSPGVAREFCPGCGATVFWHNTDRPELIDVSVGLFNAKGARAEDWLEWWKKRVSFAEDRCESRGLIWDPVTCLVRGLEGRQQ